MHLFARTIFGMANITRELAGSVKDSWDALSADQRTIVGVLATIDLAGKSIALWDMARTDDRKLRGPKWLWTPVIGAVNTLGWVAYFTVGKKR